MRNHESTDVQNDCSTRVNVTALLEYIYSILTTSLQEGSVNPFQRDKCKLDQLPECAVPYTIIPSCCPAVCKITSDMC